MKNLPIFAVKSKNKKNKTTIIPFQTKFTQQAKANIWLKRSRVSEGGIWLWSRPCAHPYSDLALPWQVWDHIRNSKKKRAYKILETRSNTRGLPYSPPFTTKIKKQRLKLSFFWVVITTTTTTLNKPPSNSYNSSATKIYSFINQVSENKSTKPSFFFR